MSWVHLDSDLLYKQILVAAADREGQTAAAACTLLCATVVKHNISLPTCAFVK